jgi:hypothetical protein
LPRKVAASLPAGSVQRSPASVPVVTLAPASSCGLIAKDCGPASLPVSEISISPPAAIEVATSMVFFATR